MKPPRPERRALWKVLGWTALILIVCLIVPVENWRGQGEWQAYLAEARAKGEPTNPYELIPAPIPDDENLAMAPLFRPVMEFASVPSKFPRWHDRV